MNFQAHDSGDWFSHIPKVKDIRIQSNNMEESFDPLDHHKRLFIHSINISEYLLCAKHCDDQINAFESINYVGETALLAIGTFKVIDFFPPIFI